MNEPLVTAIVSTYNAEHFMRGCLQDLVSQTLLSEMEVLVVDSGSQQGESTICTEFAREHPQIRFIRTEREPLIVQAGHSCKTSLAALPVWLSFYPPTRLLGNSNQRTVFVCRWRAAQQARLQGNKETHTGPQA